MVYKYSTWHRKTAGSRFLRRIMCKFLVRSEELPADTWGEPFDGTGCRPLSVEEDMQWGEGKGEKDNINKYTSLRIQ